jgi:hypothetical protein
MNYTFEEALEIFDSFNYSDQEILIDVISKRMVERRRKEIKSNADETILAIEKGIAKKGSLQDLLKSID